MGFVILIFSVAIVLVMAQNEATTEDSVFLQPPMDQCCLTCCANQSVCIVHTILLLKAIIIIHKLNISKYKHVIV